MNRVTIVGVVLIWLATAVTAQDPDSFGDCEAQVEDRPQDRSGADCFYSVTRDGGAPEEAVRRLDALIERWPDSPWLRYNRANTLMLWRAGHDEVGHDYREAIQLFGDLGDVDGEALARANLVMFLSRRADFQGALDELPEAEAAAAAASDYQARWALYPTRFRLLGQMGGDLQMASQALLQGWEVISRPALDDEPHIWSLRRSYLSALGEVAYYLGDYSMAQELYKERRDRARQEGDRRNEVAAAYELVVSRIAHDLPKEENKSEALAELQQVLGTAQELRHPFLEAAVRLLIAKMEGGPEAESHLERCRFLAVQLPDTALLRRCLLARASLCVEDDPETARRLLSEVYAGGIFVSKDSRALVDTRDDHLRVLWNALPRDDALAGIERVLADVEAVRRPQTGLARGQILEVWSDTYYWLAGRLLEEATESGDEPRQAFAVMERLRAQELREVLLLAGEDSPWLPPPPAGLLDDVVATLAEDEAMLSYQLALDRDVYDRPAGGAWVLVSTREGTRVERLAGDRTVLEPMVMALVDQKDGRWNAPTLEALHEYLLEPALADLPETIERLVLNPDGVLHLLPFAALRPDGGPSLGERFEISDVPSADLWLQWKKSEGARSSSSALVLAAPEIPEAAAETGADLLRTVPRSDDLGPLRHAGREGRRVLRHLRNESRLLRGPGASERVLKRADLEPYGLLHFATHAVVDYEKPWLSGVLLSRGDDSEDGWLRPEEIAALDLDGKVIILSTCNSAAGRSLRGEGVTSLARAFFKAGAHAVVGTLRPLPDDHGERFFDDFYRHLSRGASLRRALAATQRKWAAEGGPASTWASVVVQGNGDLVPAPGGIGKLWLLRRWALLFAGFLALWFLGVLVRRWRRPPPRESAAPRPVARDASSAPAPRSPRDRRAS